MDVITSDAGRPPQNPIDTASAQVAAPSNDPADEDTARRLLAQADRVLQDLAVGAPADFATQLFARAAPEDLVALRAGRTRRDRRRHLALSRRTHGGTRRSGSHAAPATFGPRLKHVSIIELVNDDMPFLVDSVMAELAERGHRRPSRRASAVCRRARRRRQADRHSRAIGAAPPAEPRCAKASSRSMSIASTIRTSRPRSSPRCRGARRRPARRRGLAHHAGRRRRRSPTLKANPPALPVDEIAETIQFLEWLMDDNFTFLGVRDYRVAMPTANCWSRFAGSSLGVAAVATSATRRRTHRNFAAGAGGAS